MRALLTALLVLLAGPAAATQDAWPALFDVTGVALDDVLNVRSAPSATSEIVGALAPDATGVEVIRPDDRQTWGLVNTGEGTGWVSLAYLARLAGQWQGAFPDPARCFGTEPFWTLTFPDGGTVSLRTPEERSVPAGSVVARLGSANRRDRHGIRIAFPDGRLSSGVISWERCTDGMSDREYGLALDLLDADRVLSGCCTLAR